MPPVEMVLVGVSRLTGSMESELFLAILSSMAEGESVSISENSKWSIQKRFESGTYKVSYPPYGYDWDGEQMVINPEQAAVVKEIFAALLSGKGTHAIADDLNRRGIPTKRNGRWTATTIRGMLSNEKYVGDCLFQKTYSDSRFVRHNNHGEQTQYMVKDHHEAIISREDFEHYMMATGEIATDVGTILYGKEAVASGLIDKLGGLNDALSTLHRMIEKQKK